jgi:hypothetical protein
VRVKYPTKEAAPYDACHRHPKILWEPFTHLAPGPGSGAFVVGPLAQLGGPFDWPLSPTIFSAMPTKKKATAAKLRNWRVSILRNRAEYLGTVEATDAAAAEALAAETFKLDGERRKRLAVRAEE